MNSKKKYSFQTDVHLRKMENKDLNIFLADWLDSQSGVVNFLDNDGHLGGLVTSRSMVR